jgi:hypothetical protein
MMAPSADNERRRDKRVSKRLECEILLDGKSYSGITENISRSDFCFRFLSGPSGRLKDFSLDSILKVKCRIRPREKVHLDASIKWVLFHKDPSKGLFDFMGVELIEAPSVYKDYVIGLE